MWRVVGQQRPKQILSGVGECGNGQSKATLHLFQSTKNKISDRIILYLWYSGGYIRGQQLYKGDVTPFVHLLAVQLNLESAAESFFSTVTPCSPVNLAIILQFQPASNKGATVLIIFSAAKSLGSYCKSQPDMRLSNYACYRDGGLLVAVKVDTSCWQSLTADFLAITANIVNWRQKTHMNTWTQTDKHANKQPLWRTWDRWPDACAALPNEPVIWPIRGSSSKSDAKSKLMLIKL